MLEDIPKKTDKASDKADWCILQLMAMDKRIDDIKPEEKESKPWYKSIGIWFVIILVLALAYLIFIFVMQEQGHNIKLPWFMK